MELLDYNLRQVAAVIPCHPRTLRGLLLSRPEVCPPFVKGPGRDAYRFEARALAAWLRARDEMRRATKRPHLRWLDPVVRPRGVKPLAKVDRFDIEMAARRIEQLEEQNAKQAGLLRQMAREAV